MSKILNVLTHTRWAALSVAFGLALASYRTVSDWWENVAAWAAGRWPHNDFIQHLSLTPAWVIGTLAFLTVFVLGTLTRILILENEKKTRALQELINKPKLFIEGVEISSVGPIPVISISFAISNPGTPTTFHDWQLWVQPTDGESVGIRLGRKLGLDPDGDLYTKPLETGGSRSTTYKILHYALADFDKMSKVGTVYSVRALDIKDREIKVEYVIPSIEERKRRLLSIFKPMRTPTNVSQKKPHS